MALSNGLVDRIDWSAIRYRSAGAPPARRRSRAGEPADGSSADGPKTAWISGANASMAGQTTRMSSSTRSEPGSLSRCSRASRSTSTWRVGPKQAWNCTERSPGSWSQRRTGSGIGPDGALQAAEEGRRVGAVAVGSTSAHVRRSGRPVGLGVGQEHGASPGGAGPTNAGGVLDHAAVGSSARSRRPPPDWRWVRPGAASSGSKRDGSRRKRWTSRCSATARTSSRNPPPGSRVNPKSTSRGGRSRTRSPSGHPVEQPGPPLGRAGLTDLVPDQAPEVGLPGGSVGQTAPGSVDVAHRRPTTGPWPAGAGGSGRTGRPPVGPGA